MVILCLSVWVDGIHVRLDRYELRNNTQIEDFLQREEIDEMDPEEFAMLQKVFEGEECSTVFNDGEYVLVWGVNKEQMQAVLKESVEDIDVCQETKDFIIEQIDLV